MKLFNLRSPSVGQVMAFFVFTLAIVRADMALAEFIAGGPAAPDQALTCNGGVADCGLQGGVRCAGDKCLTNFCQTDTDCSLEKPGLCLNGHCMVTTGVQIGFGFGNVYDVPWVSAYCTNTEDCARGFNCANGLCRPYGAPVLRSFESFYGVTPTRPYPCFVGDGSTFFSLFYCMQMSNATAAACFPNMTASGGAYHVSHTCIAPPTGTFCFNETVLGPHNSGNPAAQSILVSNTCAGYFTSSIGGQSRGEGYGYGRPPFGGGPDSLYQQYQRAAARETRPSLIQNNLGLLLALFLGFFGTFGIAFLYMLLGSKYLWTSLRGYSAVGQ